MKNKEDISLSSLVKTSTKNRKRIGRGIGSGHGKTATRGTKGMRARKGSKKGPGFEGGQLPFHLRIPKKRGFNRPWKKSFQVINLDLLESLELKDVNPKILFERRLISSLFKPVKILGKTELKSPMKIMAHAISKPALEMLKAVGGEFKAL